MSRSEEPLLRRLSPEAEDRSVEDEDALLTGATAQSTTKSRRWREIGLSIWAVIATVALVVLAVLLDRSRRLNTETESKPVGKRNLIFMVSDVGTSRNRVITIWLTTAIQGMGPTSMAMTRSFRQYTEGLLFDDTLVLDRYEVGKSRTRSTSSLITDSAAGATAFACGTKSYNGAISTLPDHTPCGTVLEAAKKAGYMTGLVVTTRITDATPACFAAHVNKREEEDRIAEQLLGDYPLGQTVDLMLGAGRGHFLPNTTQGSSRQDDKDLIEDAKRKGYTYVESRKEFDALRTDVKLPLLGLFAVDDLPYEIDRQYQTDVYPSLSEMATTALEALSEATRDSDKGFFLMVEGSRIDHCGHANDPAAQVHEVLAYDEAFDTVLRFIDQDSTSGLLIATSDHETGGLATGRQINEFEYPLYKWFPGVLANASHSHHWIAHEYGNYLHEKHDLSLLPPITSTDDGEGTSDELAARSASAFLQDAVEAHLGIYDASKDEINKILDNDLMFTGWLLSDMISRRAQTGWSTHGHSAADVNIYASDPNIAKALQGNHENTEIGLFMMDYLGVDVKEVTRELQQKNGVWNSRYADGYGWMGKIPVEGENMDGGSHLQKYQGEFKMRT